jgi:uncharacterized protein YbjT (DUF2867 family)
MSKETIFITGASGNVGMHVFDNLDRNKFKVKLGLRSTEKSKAFEKKGYDVKTLGEDMHVIDLLDKGSLVKAFKGVDKLFIIPPADQERARMAINAIEAARECGVKYVALFSVINASEERRIMFQKQFAEAEEALKKSGLKWTIFQSPWFQENIVEMKKELSLPLRDGAIPIVSLKDIGRAIAMALMESDKHVGKVYQLTGPRSITGHDMAKALSEAHKQEVKYYDISREEAAKNYKGKNVPGWLVDGLLELMEDYANKRYQPTDHIKRITGKEAMTLNENLKMAVTSM